MKNNYHLLETLICVPLGFILTLMLLQVCVTTMKPLTEKLEEIQTQQEQQEQLLEEVLDYE